MDKNTIEYKNYINSLFDLYGNLLTDKQQEYFKYYYFDDFSLREIANTLGVSCNAIYDQLKKIEKSLTKYEELLGLYKKNEKLEELLCKYENNTDNSDLLKLIEEIRNME